MNKEIEEALGLLIERSDGTDMQEAIAKIEGYIYGLLTIIEKQ